MSDSSSYSSSAMSASTGMSDPRLTPEQPRYHYTRVQSRGRSNSGRISTPEHSAKQRFKAQDTGDLDSLIDDWMGDERSLISMGEDSRFSINSIPKKKSPAIPDDLIEGDDERAAESPLMKPKKKKLVPRTSSKSSSVESVARCYLVRGAQTQGSLIEHYSETPVDTYLGYWTPPADKKIPKFKFTQNWGKNEIVNATQGDLRGKRAYYSGICQWIRSAKTFDGQVRLCRHVPGWECDLYLYFLESSDGVQTVLIRDGQLFSVSSADGIAIVPRGSDFLHYDPRFQCGIDKWVSEGSKLGFAAKLEVRVGSAFPKRPLLGNRLIGDAARPSGGASYNDMARDYARGKERSEWNKIHADERLTVESRARNQAERQAAKYASEQASREVRGMEARERARVDAERLAQLEISSGKKMLRAYEERRINLPPDSKDDGEETLKHGNRKDSDHSGISSIKSRTAKPRVDPRRASSTPRRANRKHSEQRITTPPKNHRSMQTTNDLIENRFPEPEARMIEGAQVYIRDPLYSYLPAIVESVDDVTKRVKVRISLPSDWVEHTIIPKGGDLDMLKKERLVRLSDYANRELPLQNLEKDGSSAMGKNDMADLPHLHEAAILYNLKARHSEGIPYTRVGDIMVAMNPFQWIEGLYSEENRFFYAKNLIWQAKPGSKPLKNNNSSQNGNQPLATAATEKQAVGYEHEKLGIKPHVYETSSLAYLGLALDRTNQTILVTGESGAGKTETIKIVMNHLATVERSRPSWPESDRQKEVGDASETVNRVLRANPVFEAFGNAKTLRNDNSSRFGKFTQLQFDVEDAEVAQSNGRVVPSCLLAGSRCITYLLEKSRVVSVGNGERTYHIFYQLLGAPEDDKKEIWEDGLSGATVSDFVYLSSVSSDNLDGLAGGDNWSETVESLAIFGIDGSLFLEMMRSLCVILQLGNLTFDPENVSGEERSNISSIEALEKVSNLMGIPESDIETAMTKRFMVTRGEEFTISLKASEARDGCDALAKEMYARIFDFLVKKINDCTQPKLHSETQYGTISLLDIFGFESFQVNRFEQLCINYANERLQQKYVMDNFQAVKGEYEEEGIDVFDFSLIDNSDVMELLEGKLGLIVQLNEECVRPNGGDDSFVYKLKVINSDSNRLIQDHLHRPYEFGIRHYAAPIKYDARKFIERNLDKIPADLLKCACQSTNSFIRREFQVLSSQLEGPKSGGPRRRSAATQHLVATKFRVQLNRLMSIIEESRTRYIRCVKPNKLMKPRTIDHSHAVSQLESAGLVTAIVISRESFPNRLSYELIMERFRFLASKFSDCQLGSGDLKLDAQNLLNRLLEGITADTHRGKVRPFACGKTKVYFRVGALEMIETTRQDYFAERALQLQTWIRSLLARRKFLTFKRGVILFQRETRRWLARKSFARKKRSALVMQCFIRKSLAFLKLLRRREEHAATKIQTRWRVMKPRKEFKAVYAATLRVQCFLRMIMCKTSYEAKKKERNAENDMESRISIIQQNFDDATTVQGTVFSVDEGLLEEVETMFDFLRKEIIVLRKKNASLKNELAEAEADKREIFNHAQSIDHSFALSKIRSEQLTRTNLHLTEDSHRRKKEITKLKNELKTQQQAHEEQLKEMKVEFDMALGHREMEVKALQSNLHSASALHKREIQIIRDESERKQEDNCAEIQRLREEIKRTHESHQDYLSKLMDVLETTQASRRDDEALRKKDAEIARLMEEVSRLRRNSSSENTVSSSASKKETVKSMKHMVKKNREQRKSRVQRLSLLTNQLEDSIRTGDKSQIHYLLDSIRDAVEAGEKANSKMDREVVNIIDQTSSYCSLQDISVDGNADYSAILNENQKLRKKLEKRNICKNCGYKRERKEGESLGDTLSVAEGVHTSDLSF